MGYEQARMLPTPPTMLKAHYSSLFLLFGPLQMSPTYLQHFLLT